MKLMYIWVMICACLILYRHAQVAHFIIFLLLSIAILGVLLYIGAVLKHMEDDKNDKDN